MCLQLDRWYREVEIYYSYLAEHIACTEAEHVACGEGLKKIFKDKTNIKTKRKKKICKEMAKLIARDSSSITLC